MSTSSEKEPISAKLDPDTKHQFRVQAAQKDMTMSQYLREIVESELDDHQS